jgi:hypothetical protein
MLLHSLIIGQPLASLKCSTVSAIASVSPAYLRYHNFPAEMRLKVTPVESENKLDNSLILFYNNLYMSPEAAAAFDGTQLPLQPISSEETFGPFAPTAATEIPTHPVTPEETGAATMAAEAMATPAEAVEDDNQRKSRLGKWGGELAIFGGSMLPVLDLVSDLGTAATIRIGNAWIETGSVIGNHALVGALIGAKVLGFTALQGLAITKNEKLKKRYESLRAYDKMRKADKPPGKIERLLEWLDDKERRYDDMRKDPSIPRHRKVLGALAANGLRGVKVNIAGTTYRILRETSGGRPPKVRRMLGLGALVAGPLIIGYEVGALAGAIPVLRTPVKAFGKGLGWIFNADFKHPLQAPIGTAAVTAIGAGVITKAVRLTRFQTRTAKDAIAGIPIETPPVAS